MKKLSKKQVKKGKELLDELSAVIEAGSLKYGQSAFKNKKTVKIARERQYRNRGIYVAQSNIAGFGVFADKSFKKGEILEISPAILVNENSQLLDFTALEHYVYTDENDNVYVGLGYTSIYNHSHLSNAEFTVMDYIIVVRARRDIAVNEEIYVNYGWDEEMMERNGIIR